MSPPLVVFPTRYLPAVVRLVDGAWVDGKGSLAGGAPLLDDGAAAFLRRWDTHAHCSSYSIPGLTGPHPRLCKACLPALREAGAPEPVLWWAHVDVDRPGHEPWPEGGEGLALDGVVAELERAGIPTGWFCYLTRAGYHVVWPLARPVPVSQAEDRLGVLVEHLRGRGLDVDRKCGDWTRLFSMPRVLRDGVALPGPIWGL